MITELTWNRPKKALPAFWLNRWDAFVCKPLVPTLRWQQILIELKWNRPRRALPPFWLNRKHEGH